MPTPFGKAFTFTFYPSLDGDAVTLPAQTLTLYVYSDKPSREQAFAGTGAVAGPYSCVLASPATSASFSISAINDPDPNSETRTEDYYVSVEYDLETGGGQDQINIRLLQMSRVGAQASQLDIVDADLSGVWSQATKICTSGERSAFESSALAELKAEFRSKGYDWDEVFRPEQLKIVLIYRTLEKIAADEMEAADDIYHTKAKEFRAEADRHRDALYLELGREEPETPVQQAGLGLWMVSK